MKIAIVENDAEQVVRFIGHIKKYSAESGEDCGVVAFGNGIDFLTDYSGDFDAVFMDIDMPLMDGMTAAEKLREIDENERVFKPQPKKSVFSRFNFLPYFYCGYMRCGFCKKA